MHRWGMPNVTVGRDSCGMNPKLQLAWSDARDPAPGSTSETAQWAAALIHSRRTTLPKRLHGPGPNADQKLVILGAAAAAPDHDQHLPWRFVEVPSSRRAALGEAFVQALRARDPSVSEDNCVQAREKALHSPWLLLALARTGPEPAEIPATERLVSAGAAIQNMLLMANALGLGSALTSGKALQSAPLRKLFALTPEEQALCFINIGQIGEARPAKSRPEVARYFSVLS